MRPHILRVILGLTLAATASATPPRAADQTDEQIVAVLASHQFNLNNEGLKNDGRAFLLHEAASNDFFLLGELHGDNEIPALLRALWPEMWKLGYRHVAAEVSPWAAHQLEFAPTGKGPDIRGLWTKQEAADVHAPAGPGTDVLWGATWKRYSRSFSSAN